MLDPIKTAVEELTQRPQPGKRRKKIAAKSKRSLKPPTPEPRKVGATSRVRRATYKSQRKVALKLALVQVEKTTNPSATGSSESLGALYVHIGDLKATRSCYPQKPRKKKAVVKQKRSRKGPVCGLSHRHHKRKMYISPEQRAINKTKDGVMQQPVKSVALYVVGEVPKVNSVWKNAIPDTRKDRLKEQFQLNRKAKYPPLRKQEVVSKAA